MLAILTALASGLLFGLGLTVSQMINPGKVIAFLDVAGSWDPSLAFVMSVAVPVAGIGFAIGARRATPLCSDRFNPPARTEIDPPLILGAVLFGIGWGLVGYCPGPALAALAIGGSRTTLFVVAMLIGMGAHRVWQTLAGRRTLRPRAV